MHKPSVQCEQFATTFISGVAPAGDILSATCTMHDRITPRNARQVMIVFVDLVVAALCKKDQSSDALKRVQEEPKHSLGLCTLLVCLCCV